MKPLPKVAAVMDLARANGLLRASDLDGLGAPRSYLGRLVRRGELVQVGRGLYSVAGAELSEHQSLAEVSRRVPRAVVTLLSALRFHELGSESPWQVWIALPRGSWRPKMENLTLEVSWLDEAALEADVERHQLGGVEVRVFSPQRAVVECFRFRSKVGLEPALEALRDYLRRTPGGMDRLWECAKRRHAAVVMRPYLEALT
jgi:predicted transcriptional regulator of viral defense system